ncbi:monovalent cation:proton antiporter family protein [Brevibacillus humidisoli]|uniref:monovalent cation:proton antiporter family protein n=1 Tax=Brevibacillus humidisoli TaxID=2895522 RepID=UPI001E585747|nr:monovalent cation:proton antiporter family protein [Brevibacillus humidisoli]UFJ39231.1 monovalent cation:proton antiporter family protein [Brevibacillus humidisoli]
MEGNHSVLSLTIVVTLSFLIPIILHRLRWRFLPVVVVEIIAGLLLGKSGLGLIHDDQWLSLLSSLGLIYLMFLSGLEIDFESFRVKSKKPSQANPLVLSAVTFVLILLISCGFALLMQWLGLVRDPWFMTLLISTISLSIVVPTLKDKGITNTPYGQTILLTAVISDFATMILLSLYVAFSANNLTKPFLLLILFVVVFFVYRFSLRFATNKLIERISRESVQLGTRGVFALILFFVVLSEEVGAESILGAFLAGVIVSLLAPSKEFTHQLTSFGFGFLIPIFFFMVGATMELHNLFGDANVLLLLPLIIISYYVSKLLPVLIWRKWFSWKETLGAGFLLPSTLSLIIAGTAVGLELGVISENVQAALIVGAVLSCVISPILFQRTVPEHVETSTRKISLIGANTINLALAKQLHQDGYEVAIYTSDPSSDQQERNYPFPMVTLSALEPEELSNYDVLNSDYVVALTSDEPLNVRIANWAKSGGVENVICRMDSEQRSEELTEGVQLFSTFLSNRLLLQVLIEYPSLLKMLEKDDCMYEVTVNNERLHNRFIRDLSFLDDALVIRIFRGNDLLIPHGNTQIRVGDILLISGDKELVRQIERAMA